MLPDLLNIRSEDRQSFRWSAAWFATVLSTLYIMRPVRDALGSIRGSTRLPNFFLYVFLTMLIVVPIYAWLVSRYDRRKLVPVVYRFLSLSLLGFSAAMRLSDEIVGDWVAPVYFVWASVSNMFMTSLFWSVLADVFSKERGKAIFGPVSGCGTVAAIVTSFIMGSVVESVGATTMLLVAAALTETGLFCFRQLDLSRASTPSLTDVPHSANPFQGFVQVVRSPYLLLILMYTFGTTLCSTTLYMQQADLLTFRWPDGATRAAVFSRMDTATLVITGLFQLVVAAPLIRFSVAAALCVLPALFVAGYGSLSATLAEQSEFALWILIVTVVLSRASVYGFSVPAIGVLYTVVTRDEKYKAKNIIDTLVIRGGDALTAWTVKSLQAVGLALPALCGLMVPVAAGTMGLSILLGRKNSRIKAEVTQPPD